MFKKVTLSMAALIAALGFASAPARAAVRFGVTIAPPVYTAPAPYVNPYADPYAYPAPAPVYAYPNTVVVHRDSDRSRFRDRDDHGRNFRRDFRDRDRRR